MDLHDDPLQGGNVVTSYRMPAPLDPPVSSWDQQLAFGECTSQIHRPVSAQYVPELCHAKRTRTGPALPSSYSGW